MKSPQGIDVIVVGAGHAGCEAALAAARTGTTTLLITADKRSIARMSCNPSIGGIGKSHLVSEIDALGGEMARNTDYSGIQFRILNLRKGPAVQSTRIQCDKLAYSTRMISVLEHTKNLEILEACVTSVLIENGYLKGVVINDNTTIYSKSVIVSPGTFLNGVIHVGNRSIPGGRSGEISASDLSKNLNNLGFKIARFKTGTPPRLHKDSIDFKAMSIQPGLEPPPLMSYAGMTDYRMHMMVKMPIDQRVLTELFHVEQFNDSMRPCLPGTDQIPCYLTYTIPKTHDIVRNNLYLSSLYGGFISGTGVRYCPSFEDKIVKFPHNQSHHVFIEPEGRNSVEVYPNGISNSLPEKVQDEFVHSIPGLENSVITQYGYAIEYDYSDPTQLTDTLESKAIKNLFFAGQINGTTGYEEAAAQGFIAGINAAAKAFLKPEIRISRTDGYIGVLIDDLVTKGIDEPYRMFTSRAEHRLMLRQDNAPFRLIEHARKIGICGNAEISAREEYITMIDNEIKRLDSQFVDSSSLSQVLKGPDKTYAMLPGHKSDLPEEVKRQIEIRLKYDGYIKRELEQIKRHSRIENIPIPPWLDYEAIKSLRFESRQKLLKIKPLTLGQAARIPGVNPADIAILDVWIKRGPTR